MRMCLESLHVSWLYSVFLGRNLGQNSAQNCPSIFCYFCRLRMSRVYVTGRLGVSRVRVMHALASYCRTPIHAYASGTRTRTRTR
ncbi:uncharacterized protein DS421_9g268620 [Arachis hypogaea]|nr:uncharacterized protein DS421_9g268620 [Arachis hypogaea]